MAKIEKKILTSIWLQFSKKLIRNLKKNVLSRGRATLSLWFEPKHNYVCPAVTEWIYEPVGLIRAGFSATGLFRLQGSIIKKKYLKVVDPLNASSYSDLYGPNQ